MYAQQMSTNFAGQEESPFFQFNQMLLSSLEQAKTWSSVDDLVSVITDRTSLEQLVECMEPSVAKDNLSGLLGYDEGYYSKIIASLIPFLKSLG